MSKIPAGYCQCGCGKQTTRVPFTDASKGYKKGDFHRFYRSHRPHGRWFRLDRKSGCHIWLGARWGKGYGVKRVDGVSTPAHRWMWELKHGQLRPGFELDHLCKHRLCVNPAHLEAVTHAENVRRSLRSKLNREKADQIRILYNLLPKTGQGEVKRLAALFNIDRTIIHDIVTGKLWT